MKLADFDYDLPEDLIALRPARPRRAARMLVVRGSGPFDDRAVTDLPALLRAGDLLVLNNTKVLAARLTGLRRRTRSEGEGARIEATLIERLGPSEWRALARPGKRLSLGDTIEFGSALATSHNDSTKAEDGLSATVVGRGEKGAMDFRFDRTGPDLDAAVARLGAPPLPPYIASRRAADAQDRDDYQTVFAKNPGAVAAPTAALHFDPPLLEALDAAGVERAEVTLHVGAGTFLPVTTEDVSAHKMHAEEGVLPEAAADAIQAARREGRRVIPVGTTALRLIEAAADAHAGAIRPWRGATDLFIAPGRRFAVADGLMTNFHLPRSTLMMLVAAMAGRERILAAYAHAVRQNYRFYSYGDACLLLPGSDGAGACARDP